MALRSWKIQKFSLKRFFFQAKVGFALKYTPLKLMYELLQ
jgi:hypothetical protein